MTPNFCDDTGCTIVSIFSCHVGPHRQLGLVCAHKSVFHCFLHPFVCIVCLVRRGCDRHLHEQVFVPPGSTQASFTATFCRTTVHQRSERRNSRNQLWHTDFRPECTPRRCVMIRIQSLMSVFLIKHQYLRIRKCDMAPLSHQR